MPPVPYVPPPPVHQVLPKNPLLYVLASVLIPGLGSILAGNAGVGALILACYLVSAVGSLFLIGIPFVIACWIWALVNAHSSAVTWNRNHGIAS